MQQVCRVHELEALEILIDDVLLVYVFQNVGSDNCVQVSVHEIENQVDVTIVLSSNHVLQSNYILVARQLLQKYDLTEGPLGISGILESVEVFFQGDNLLRPLIYRLPDNTIRSLSYNKQSFTKCVTKLAVV